MLSRLRAAALSTFSTKIPASGVPGINMAAEATLFKNERIK